jgi:26S proteasome regulatory subunit N6
MENELCRLVEPYSYVQVSYIARVVGRPVESVEKKLAQMILDKKFNGSLHQGEGALVVYGDAPSEKFYERMVQTIQGVSKAVDVLWEKAQAI